MKKFTDFVFGYSFIFFVIISFAFAQTTELPDRAKALDSNSNGVIDRDEAQGPLQQQFNRIDRDNSGSLDGAEITSFFRGGRSGEKSKETSIADSGKMELPERARGLDNNTNGFIDKSEAVGPLKEKFSLIDSDKNGRIETTLSKSKILEKRAKNIRTKNLFLFFLSKRFQTFLYFEYN